MKTKFFLTALLLGFSLSAFCLTAQEMFSPGYPRHTYGGARLDSIIESDKWGNEVHFAYDDRGRMITQRIFDLDEETHQNKFRGELHFSYGDGIVYTAVDQHIWDGQNQLWEDFTYKFVNVVYDASGNPLQFMVNCQDPQTGEWIEDVNRQHFQYDEEGRIVLLIDSTFTDSGTWHVYHQTYEYVLDGKGRVIVEIDSENGKTEYTYNTNGDIITEKKYHLSSSYSYDDETQEMVKDSTWFELSYTTQYFYNSLSNLEKKIEYNSNNEEQGRTIYYYSFRSNTTEVEDATVSATPSENYSVLLQWPAVSGADTYVLEIRKEGVRICTLTFNAQGQLIAINLAPARDGARKAQTATQTTNGWQYKLEGLDEDTEYSYTAIAKKNDMVLSAQTVFFTTSLHALDDILSDSDKPVKLLRNGQVLILRADRTYTLTGQEVK